MKFYLKINLIYQIIKFLVINIKKIIRKFKILYLNNMIDNRNKRKLIKDLKKKKIKLSKKISMKLKISNILNATI